MNSLDLKTSAYMGRESPHDIRSILQRNNQRQRKVVLFSSKREHHMTLGDMLSLLSSHGGHDTRVSTIRDGHITSSPLTVTYKIHGIASST